MKNPIEFLKHFYSEVLGGKQRVAVLTTTDESRPHSRHIILRNFNWEEQWIEIYTNSNSAKVLQINNNPNTNIAWYDQEKQMQIIFNGTSSIHSDGNLVQEIKSNLPEHAFKDYLGLNPGEEYSSQLATELLLSIIKFKILTIDILVLGKSEHLRFQLQPIANPTDGTLEFNVTRLTP